MQRKKTWMCLFGLGVGVLILIIYVFLRVLYMWPGFYKDNLAVDIETNKEIKSLILSAVRDENLILFKVNEENIYTEEYGLKKSSLCVRRAKVLFVSIDSDFMDSLQKEGEDEYLVIVQKHFPEELYYYFTIKEIRGQYFISDCALDI